MKQRNRGISIAVWIGMFMCTFFSVYGQVEEEDLRRGDSFLFSFQPGEADIQATYGNNAIELERLNRKIWPAMNPLTDGEFHVLIVSHIYSETGAVSRAEVNVAAWRANTVRRYLKNKYELENWQIAFYVDRSGEWGNSVHVYLLYFPMPDFANQQIFYSEEQSNAAISAVFKRYPRPPYIYVMNDPELCTEGEPFAYVVIDNKAELPYEEGMMAAVAPPVAAPRKEVVTLAQKEEPSRQQPVEEEKADAPSMVVAQQQPVRQESHPVQPETLPKEKYHPVYQPVNLTVRTNLLPWATLSPGLSIGTNGAQFQTGAIMPNLELEYMFGGWGSVVLGGTYARFGYKDNPNNLWGVSEVLLEPRLWFNDTGTYRGFNVGLQMKYGNFNVRDNEPLGHGQTGQFFGIGAMLNCLQPIYGGLALEAGVGFGTRITFDASVYNRDYETQVSETVEKFSLTHFMINFRLALVYRFGFK